MADDLRDLALRLGRALADRGLTLATAESCTGGLVACRVTDIPGSSAWFLGGVVSYSNAAKCHILGVPQAVLDTAGAVSRETVLAMAKGARGIFGTDLAVAISGVAGPDGGSPEKPVGTVWLAWEGPFGAKAALFHFDGGRLEVKEAAARTALETMLTLVRDLGPDPS